MTDFGVESVKIHVEQIFILLKGNPGAQSHIHDLMGRAKDRERGETDVEVACWMGG